MPSFPKLEDAFNGCGRPSSSSSDLLAWNSLAGGATKSAKTELKVGIFGYDITCVEEWCAGLIK
jgi:hypothetical protein